jgi:hypothetical protein
MLKETNGDYKRGSSGRGLEHKALSSNPSTDPGGVRRGGRTRKR